jgi:hypothetical protein
VTSTIDDCLKTNAYTTAPDVHYGEAALVPFRQQYNRSITPSERAKVVDDWNHMIIATQNMCNQALMTPPFEMQTHPSDSIARSFRYEEDGRIVVEIHFNMFLGVDRAEMQALKAEMQRNKEETDIQLNELREAITHNMRASSVERQEMCIKMAAMQNIIEARDAKDALAKQKMLTKKQKQRERQKSKPECVPSTEDDTVENQETDIAATTTFTAPTFSCTVEACNGISFESNKELLNHSRKHVVHAYPCTNLGCTETLKRQGHVKRHLLTCKFTVG